MLKRKKKHSQITTGKIYDFFFFFLAIWCLSFISLWFKIFVDTSIYSYCKALALFPVLNCMSFKNQFTQQFWNSIFNHKVKHNYVSISHNLRHSITVELFQILKDDAVKVLYSICPQIWKTQQWTQDWKRSVFIPIPKNTQTTTQLHSPHMLVK